MLTAYDYSTARVFDEAGIPVLLVGDSAANVVYGYDTTVPVTVDELLPLVRGVVRGTQRALVVADLPFGSYQASPQQALETATRFMKEGGAQAVKLEGGQRVAAQVEAAGQRRHPGDGAHRPHPAVGERPRRLPRAGPRRRGCAPAAAGRQGAAARRRVRGRARGRAVRGRGPGDRAQLHIPTIGIGAGARARRPGARLAGHGRAARRASASRSSSRSSPTWPACCVVRRSSSATRCGPAPIPTSSTSITNGQLSPAPERKSHSSGDHNGRL